MKAPGRRQWRRPGVFIVNGTYLTPYFNISIVNFEQVIAGWDSV